MYTENLNFIQTGYVIYCSSILIFILFRKYAATIVLFITFCCMEP